MIQPSHRPQTTVVLAMSADGKIADAQRSPAQFGSPSDKAHLENQVAEADGILFGAGTLRAGGTAMTVANPDLLRQRQRQRKPPQPLQIVCSRSGVIDPQLRFFRQAVPRWLLTTAVGAAHWQGSEFEQVLAIETATTPLPSRPDQQSHPLEGTAPGKPSKATPYPEIDWIAAFEYFAAMNLRQLAVLGGGELVASLLAVDLIDEIWLTICPLLLGGANAPTPVDGAGFLADLAPRLELLKVQPAGQEVFLHYRLLPQVDSAANLPVRQTGNS